MVNEDDVKLILELSKEHMEMELAGDLARVSGLHSCLLCIPLPSIHCIFDFVSTHSGFGS